MKGFDLHEPTTVAQAVGLLDQLGTSAKVLAGGSDIVGGVLKDWVTGKGMPCHPPWSTSPPSPT